MREIKFRAWDKREDKYSDLKDRMYYDVFIISNVDLSINGLRFDRKDFEEMQYTGLKDMNGKEIYEGDIVEYFNELTKKRMYLEVMYINGSFSVGCIDCMGCTTSLLYVIGNIFENPELLESTE
jgi:uncharacterized phage protein (TIGR01671 family)